MQTETMTEQDSAQQTLRLAEENRRLSAENLRLREERIAEDVGRFMGELRSQGKLTPAMEHSGVEHALLFAEAQELQLSFPDGSSAALGQVLRELLAALPQSFTTGSSWQGEGLPTTLRLSEDERRIASQLGLSEEEYASMKEERD